MLRGRATRRDQWGHTTTPRPGQSCSRESSSGRICCRVHALISASRYYPLTFNTSSRFLAPIIPMQASQAIWMASAADEFHTTTVSSAYSPKLFSARVPGHLWTMAIAFSAALEHLLTECRRGLSSPALERFGEITLVGESQQVADVRQRQFRLAQKTFSEIPAGALE